MATVFDKTYHIPPPKSQKLFILTQIPLRILAAAVTLAATSITLTNKQTAVIYGIQIDARYSYSPALKFFAYANLIACAFAVLSLFLALILRNKAVDSTYYFYMFLHDLVMTILLMAGCAAATAVGYVGKYGDRHAGWMAVCGYFEEFCNRGTAASSLSYFGFLFYFILTVVSANRSRHFQV
ncbi:CASP-like protein 1F1 [Sesamum angolense]|uniref:CASP-like protein n=1 Tax=Sesamum angolense TaxID=2727404 RepID=A0AAE2BRY2_9LAMI|nr:CASP-like protein 1F1 [Sesamum angolense]